MAQKIDIQSQLDALSDQEYQALKDAVNKKALSLGVQPSQQQTPFGRFLTGAGRAIRAGGEGMLLASQGRPLSQGIYTNPEQPKVLNIQIPKPGKYEPQTKQDVIDIYNATHSNQSSEYKPTTMDEALDLYRQKKEIESQFDNKTSGSGEYKPKTMDEAIDFERRKQELKVSTPKPEGEYKPKTMVEALRFEKRKKQIDSLYSKDSSSNKDQSVAEKKFNIEQEDRQRQLKLANEEVTNNAKDTLDSISEIRKGMNNFGLTGGLPAIPGTDKVNWESNINKLLSQKIVNLMTTMKQASKTGATGFGALSQKELKVLQDASTALKKTMSPEDADRYLTQMESSVNKILSNNNGNIQYIRTGTLPDGTRVGMKADGTTEIIENGQ